MQRMPILSNCRPNDRIGLGRYVRKSPEKLLPRHLSNESLKAHLSEVAKNPRQLKRADPIDAEHVIQWSSIIGHKHRAAFARSPPQAAPPIRDLPIRQIHADISVEQLKTARRPRPGHLW